MIQCHLEGWKPLRREGGGEGGGVVEGGGAVGENGYFWLSVSLSKSGHGAKHADGERGRGWRGGRREGGGGEGREEERQKPFWAGALSAPLAHSCFWKILHPALLKPTAPARRK